MTNRNRQTISGQIEIDASQKRGAGLDRQAREPDLSGAVEESKPLVDAEQSVFVESHLTGLTCPQSGTHSTENAQITNEQGTTESVPVIEITDMTKIYQMGDTQVHALNGISLTINEGEYVAIIGASGSGKSTLMNMIGLLDNPTSGSYRIRGTETSELSEGCMADLRNAEIGFVFQRFNLLARTDARLSYPSFTRGHRQAKHTRWP